MRTIKQTGQFKRDLKRESKGRHRATLEADLLLVIDALANDAALEVCHRDHALTGDWKDHRDCHVKPDLVLILPEASCRHVGAGPARVAFRTWTVRTEQ